MACQFTPISYATFPKCATRLLAHHSRHRAPLVMITTVCRWQSWLGCFVWRLVRARPHEISLHLGASVRSCLSWIVHFSFYLWLWCVRIRTRSVAALLDVGQRAIRHVLRVDVELVAAATVQTRVKNSLSFVQTSQLRSTVAQSTSLALRAFLINDSWYKKYTSP